jgi:hypothetical protein
MQEQEQARFDLSAQEDPPASYPAQASEALVCHHRKPKEQDCQISLSGCPGAGHDTH